MKEYKKIIKGIIISTIVMSILYLTGAINLTSLVDSNNSEICWNIITINSVFAGFMFTSLSMLISVITSDTIKRLERASLMEEVYKNILCGVYCSLISITFALIIIFILPNLFIYLSTQEKSILKEIGNSIGEKLIPFLMIHTMILSILCFLGSVLDVSFIIKDLRKKINKSSISEENKREILKKIK